MCRFFGSSARETVDGCTPSVSAISRMVGDCRFTSILCGIGLPRLEHISPLDLMQSIAYRLQPIALMIGGNMTKVAPRYDAPPAGGIIGGANDVTPLVLRAMAQTDNTRLRTVADAFVRHMHAFVREVGL